MLLLSELSHVITNKVILQLPNEIPTPQRLQSLIASSLVLITCSMPAYRLGLLHSIRPDYLLSTHPSNNHFNTSQTFSFVCFKEFSSVYLQLTNPHCSSNNTPTSTHLHPLLPTSTYHHLPPNHPSFTTPPLLYTTPPLRHSTTPPLHHSSTPLHHSTTPPLHHSTTSSLDQSTTPLTMTTPVREADRLVPKSWPAFSFTSTMRRPFHSLLLPAAFDKCTFKCKRMHVNSSECQ